VGASKAIITATKLSGGAGAVKAVPGNGTCDNSPTFGQCTSARFAVSEYTVDVPGPTMLAVHVIDGTGGSDAAPSAKDIGDPSIDANPPQNGGVVGAAVQRGSTQTYVVASSAKDGVVSGSLTYGVPGSASSRHVVFDAPEAADGTSQVTATSANGRCTVTIAAGGGGGFAGHPLIFSLGNACTPSEDKGAPPGGVGPGQGAPGGPATGGTGGTAGASANGSGSSGGCNVGEGSAPIFGAAGLLLALAALTRRRSSRG
jgi:uncharacterized protein (TIGR03382 family)